MRLIWKSCKVVMLKELQVKSYIEQGSEEERSDAIDLFAIVSWRGRTVEAWEKA